MSFHFSVRYTSISLPELPLQWVWSERGSVLFMWFVFIFVHASPNKSVCTNMGGMTQLKLCSCRSCGAVQFW